MLSERDRKTLDEMARGIQDEDPKFARRFELGFERRPALWPYTAAVAFSIVLLAVGIGLAMQATAVFAAVLVVFAIAARLLAAGYAARHDEGE
ncbi:MAG: DUF3040 domain-containing protein [Stackebrandtia sp.]